MPEPAVPTVAPRKDPPRFYGQSRAQEISGKDPGYHYEWFHEDPDHPQYFGNKLRAHEIGGPASGFAMVEPWEVVTQGQISQGKKRADDGKPVDTKVTHGRMVLLRTTKENYALYAERDARRDIAETERLQRISRAGGRNGTAMRESVRAGSYGDGAADAALGGMLDAQDLYANAPGGH